MNLLIHIRIQHFLQEAIDTNSAFFARAASKAPTLQQNGFVPHSEPIKDQPPNNNKKKKNNQATKQQQPTAQSKKNKKQNANSSTEQNNKKCNTKEDNTTKITTSSKTTITQTTNTITPPKTEQNISPKINTTKSETSNGSDIDGIILQSRQVAVQGNQMAQTGDYHGAVKMFSKAIQLDPSDFRYDYLDAYLGPHQTSMMELFCQNSSPRQPFNASVICCWS